MLSTNLRRRIRDDNWQPTACCFTYEAPSNLEAHRKAFGPHLTFGAPRNRLSFDDDILRAELCDADPGLYAICKEVLHAAACDALVYSDDSVTEIAQRLGFPKRVRSHERLRDIRVSALCTTANARKRDEGGYSNSLTNVGPRILR